LYRDSETLSHDLLQLKRQYAAMLQDNSFLKAQVQRLAGVIKKKDNQLQQLLGGSGTGVASIGRPATASSLSSTTSGTYHMPNTAHLGLRFTQLSARSRVLRLPTPNTALDAGEDERRLQRLKQELMSVGVLTERVRVLETELTHKEAELRAVKSTQRQGQIRELQAEAQVRPQDAHRYSTRRHWIPGNVQNYFSHDNMRLILFSLLCRFTLPRHSD
jgi:uncharacterized small protein (DUF1192 family)